MLTLEPTGWAGVTQPVTSALQRTGKQKELETSTENLVILITDTHSQSYKNWLIIEYQGHYKMF